MKKRESTLFNNDVLLAGILIDPKARALLEDEELRRARTSFVKIATKIHSKQQNSNDHDTPPQPPVNCSYDEFNETNSMGASFEDRLNHITVQRLEQMNEDNTAQLQNFKHKITEGLQSMELFDRARPLLEVITSYPKPIQPASFICTAMPCSQASVERLFSAVNLIQTPRRPRSKKDLIRATVFMRVNGYE